jgi:hypothetical protein
VGPIFQLGCGAAFIVLGLSAAIGGGLLVWRGRESGALALGCGALAALAGAAWIGAWLVSMRGSETTERKAFYTAFGVSASPSVTNIRSFEASSTDTFQQCMVFESDPQIIRRILEQRRYVREGRTTSIMPRCGKELAWWKPGRNLDVWTLQPYAESWSSSRSSVACPATRGLCYFHASGGD